MNKEFEDKINWIFDALHFQLQNQITDDEARRNILIDEADRVIIDLETEEENPVIKGTKQALSDVLLGDKV